MERVVYDHAVEQDFVLDGRAAADVELTPLVAGAHETGHDLEGLDQVRLAAEAGDALEVGGADGGDGEVDFRLGFLAVRRDFRTSQLDHTGNQ